jgi:hypothetical protein
MRTPPVAAGDGCPHPLAGAEARRKSEFRNQKSGARIGEKFDHPEPDTVTPVAGIEAEPERGARVLTIDDPRAAAQSPRTVFSIPIPRTHPLPHVPGHILTTIRTVA